jgi:hypothetical protein
MNISVSSLVRRLERELEAEKLKSAKLEIKVKQLEDNINVNPEQESNPPKLSEAYKDFCLLGPISPSTV